MRNKKIFIMSLCLVGALIMGLFSNQVHAKHQSQDVQTLLEKSTKQLNVMNSKIQKEETIEPDNKEDEEAQRTKSKAGSFQITSEHELSSLFPDANFRSIVFQTVKNGNDGAIGVDIEDALANFQGDIKASGQNKSDDKKIRDVTGIDLLRNANTVVLTYNEISDFSKLGSNATKTSNIDELKTYYGYNVANLDDREYGMNVYWNIGGNPISKLPEDFGGRIVIEQAGKYSYTYPTDNMSYVYLRGLDDKGAVTGEIDVAKAKVVNKANIERNVKLIIVQPTLFSAKGDRDIGLKILDWDKVNYQSASFSFLTSGSTHIAVGTDQEIHYWTDDEYGSNRTEGSQSFKYYLAPSFDVYDVVQGYSSYGVQVKLTKTDEDNGEPIKGAIYNVYKENGELYLADLETDNQGEIKPTILTKGNYYFQETKAPDGYVLNNEKIPFEIVQDLKEEQWDIIVGGGKNEIDIIDAGVVQSTINAKTFETNPMNKYRKATFLSATSAPLDLKTAKDNATKELGAHVTFCCFKDRFGVEQQNYTKYYETLQAAQDDINKIVSENRNYGAIKVVEIAQNKDKDEIINKSTTDKKIKKINIKVEKTWDDAINQSKRPTSLSVELYRKDVAEPIATAVLNKENHWAFTFQEIPSTDQVETTYDFFIKEQSVIGYHMTKNELQKSSDGKEWVFALTNTLDFSNTETPNIPTQPSTPNQTISPKTRTNAYFFMYIIVLISCVVVLARVYMYSKESLHSKNKL